MKSVLIAVLVNTIMASSLAAQKFPPPAKADTNSIKIFRGTNVEPAMFAKDSAAWDDSLAIIKAVADSVGPGPSKWITDNGWRNEGITLVGDTAWVLGATLRSHARVDTVLGRVIPGKTIIFDYWTARVERRNGKWVQVSRKKK